MYFSVYTLGCKLNQLESEAIADSFCREGFTFVPWDSVPREPSILVINTCTVTSMADQKARHIIRKTLRDHPAACLIITGCYAQMDREVIAGLVSEHSSVGQSPVEQSSGEGERLFVIPGEEKDRILDLPRFLAGAGAAALPGLVASWLASFRKAFPDEQKQGNAAFRFRPENFASHSRGFLKIQDGCDHRCTYCRVSLARGKSRSLDAAEILQELQSLERRGFAEVVITGVNIMQYRASGFGLSGLLDFLLKETEKIRIRLSSIEPGGGPGGFSPEQSYKDFAGVLSHPRIRPHFHLSVQSGSPAILAKMGRTYTPADIERSVLLLRSIREDPFLACDIIAGFPGETESEFEKTRELCEHSGFAWIHAFPFSRRPGTAAYDFPGQVSAKDAVKRVEVLTALARKGRQQYLGRWEGKEVEAVVEKRERSKLPGLPSGFVPGLSENYLKLLIACGGESMPAPGSLIRCRISPGSGTQRSSGPENPHFDAWAERVDSICRGGQNVV